MPSGAPGSQAKSSLKRRTEDVESAHYVFVEAKPGYCRPGRVNTAVPPLVDAPVVGTVTGFAGAEAALD